MDSIPFLFTEDTLINRLIHVFNKQDFKKKKQQLPQAENHPRSSETSTTHRTNHINKKQHAKQSNFHAKTSYSQQKPA